jgi:spore photoproduct lyase
MGPILVEENKEVVKDNTKDMAKYHKKTIENKGKIKNVRSIPSFEPDLVFFEPDSLNYPLGQELMKRFKEKGIPIKMTTSHNRVTGIPGDTPTEAYRNAKRTMVVGVRKTLTFDTSKPSAEYAIPLSTGCMGHCHYCYLQTTLGAKPYIRVYVNTDDF